MGPLASVKKSANSSSATKQETTLHVFHGSGPKSQSPVSGPPGIWLPRLPKVKSTRSRALWHVNGEMLFVLRPRTSQQDRRLHTASSAENNDNTHRRRNSDKRSRSPPFFTDPTGFKPSCPRRPNSSSYLPDRTSSEVPCKRKQDNTRWFVCTNHFNNHIRRSSSEI